MINHQTAIFRQKIVVFAMSVQTTVTFIVLLFCMFSLWYEEDISNKAVLYSLITGTMGYWFPSPINQIMGTEEEANKSKDYLK